MYTVLEKVWIMLTRTTGQGRGDSVPLYFDFPCGKIRGKNNPIL